jgi:DNA mismatch repair protein MutS
VLRHYVELKRAHPERVLLYRLGDFFECFFEDAITLSRELELTLTGKDAGKSDRASANGRDSPTTPPSAIAAI